MAHTTQTTRPHTWSQTNCLKLKR